MKKKVFSLMMTLLLAVTGLVRAGEITVHDGTTQSSYIPVWGLWTDNSLQHEFVYPAAELAAMNGGEISVLKFYSTSSYANVTWNGSFQVFMKEVGATTLTSFLGTSDATLVYEGSLGVTSQEMEITLATPYTYNGGNLWIGVYYTSTTGYSSCYWFGETVTGASIYGRSGASYAVNSANFLPKTTFTFNGGGGGGGATSDQLFALQDGEVVETIAIGSRPNGYWMEPFTFQIRNDGAATTVTRIDFTPDNYFTIVAPEMPVAMANGEEIDVQLSTGTTDHTAWQMVAIYGVGRTARVWDITAEPYDPATPDVWEMACEEATTFPFVEVPATAHSTTLHNDYTLPFPEIPEGYDAVYKLVFANDQIMNAEVTAGADGKVALYTQDFNGEGGPMATNNYTIGSAGTGGAGYEAMIGDETSTTYTAYMPFYTLYNYSISEALFTAAELQGAGVTTAAMGSLSWEAIDVTTTQAQQNISIWMANVADTELTTTSHLASGMTLVYTGGIPNIPPLGWNEFVFNEGSFAWDGVSNVLILVQRNNGQWNGHVNWRSHNPGFYGMAYKYQDSTPYDAANQTYDLTRSNTSRPNTLFRSVGRTDTPDPGVTPTSPAAGDMSYGPVITDAAIPAGTYYLVASSTDADFEVTINADPMPCPAVEDFAFNPMPADDEDDVEPASVTLHWMIPEYATGWRLVFGSTYYPDPTHPQTVIYPEDGSFSTQMANSFTVRNLWNNMNYFWHVEFNNNGACPEGVSSPIWGFTTHLNVPQNLTVVDETVFDDEQIVLNWNPIVDRTYRMYFVYRDGVKIAQTTTNQVNLTTYTDGPLAYNMGGYHYYVTAVYDEGESAPSNEVVVKVSGYGDVNGHVFEQDGSTGIANATVTMVGQDEYGTARTYNFTTNGEGYYSGHIYTGRYDGSATCNGYQGAEEPIQGNPIDIIYNNTTSPIDYMMDENYYSPCTVIAQYYPDSLDPQSPYVKVYWGCGLPGNNIIEDFETGDFSLFDWQVDPTYPWTITTTSPYEGTYCMKSGGAGVANVVSNMTVTVDIPADGIMSFFGKISCESNWDYGYFYIDGVQKGNYTGAGNWTERTFDITSGEHTFQWQYTKDGSVNSNDDCFYVDYITFYKQPEPAAPGMTYDFENSTMQGWTSVDADGDGYGWYVASEIMSTGYGHNGSNDCVLSQSYNNNVGVLYPDNYLVSPQVQLGGIVRFYACAQDASYAAEHFGVAVSTTNTNPGSFSMVQEWTMTAKSVNDGGKAVLNSRSGRAQGNWYEYTVDLSAYSGNGYVAIRHFNCSDMFYLDVDDITIGEPGKGLPTNDRVFSHYRVYRTNCYNDGPYTEENTVVLACELQDTLYIDVSWPDVAPGVYKWGVSCTYIGNRGEVVESPITWSEPVNIKPDKSNRDIVYDFENGMIPSDWTNDPTYPWTVVNDAYAGYNGTYCIRSGNSGVASSTSSISTTVDYAEDGTVSFLGGFWGEGSSDTYDWDKCRFYIDGAIMIDYGAHDAWENVNFNVPAGSHTFTWTYKKDGSVNPTGDAFFVDDVTFTTSGSGGGNSGSNPYGPGTEPIQEDHESVIVWSNCLDKDMWLNAVTVNVLLNSADNPEGTTVDFTNLNEFEQQNYPIDQIVLDESGFYAFETFRRGDYAIKVRHEGYVPIDDTVSIWENTDLRYVMTEILYGTGNVYVSRTGWAMWDEANVPGGGGGGGQGGNGDTFTVDFESGMPAGWTVIDGNNDGWTWCLTSAIPTTWTYYASLTLDWYHGGSNAICSGSYINGVGALTPNEYLVSPQVTLASGSQLSFWVAATDASYPADHFGVFVSDNGTSDWTSVQEWTLTAKKSGLMGGSASRNGEGLRLGTWYNYTVDLSAFAGQKYIAFRHFDCNDQYIMCLDDIALTGGAKSDDRHFEYYKVLCTSIDGVPIYNHNTVHPFCQLTTDGPYNAPLVEGEHYLCKVAVVYSTGISEWSEPVEWEYEPCDHWGPVDEVTVGATTQGNHIEWVFEHGYNPYDPGTGPVPPTPGQGDWYYYDNGVNVDAIGLTAGGSFYWGVMFPAGSYTGNMVTKVSMYDYSAHTGNILVYQGGATAPATLVGQQAYNCTGSNDFVEWEFAAPVAIDPTQNLWIVMNNNNGQYVASMCDYTGDPNGTMLSIDGNDWSTLAEATGGQLSGTWMIRAYVASGAKGEPQVLSYNGKSSNGGTFAISGNGPRTRTVIENVNFAMVNESMLEFNIADVANFDGRVYFLYNLVNDSRFTVVNGEESGEFIVSTDGNINLKESFADFVEQTMSSFAGMDKYAAADFANQYKGTLPMNFANSMMMDIYARSRDNSHCADAYPFCTDEGMYEFPAGVNAGSGETGPDYDCLYTTPNPAWYYMKMSDPGDMDIYMYSTPSVDIDFCCWGPFADPTSPCPNGLTSDKVVSCSYSAQPTEHCMIPASAQTGEYYILVITNYSNQSCNINFSKVGGSGSTDCSIIPPTNVDLIGFLITQDGEYLAFAGPDDREYTDIDEFGDHEYCVRPIYPGEMVLPSNNFGWSMGCPVCAFGPNGQSACEPGAPIYGEALNETDQIKVWWGEENPGPGPGGCEGDEFTVNFESGIPAGWTTIDADGDGYNWNLASATMGTGYGHNGSSDMIFSQSYDNNYGALTPDNYLVTPAVTLCEGSTFSFYACAQDASWASEHFGVAISDDGVNFGMVQEWTMTAKGQPYSGPRGMRDQGNWYQYTVNLGDYAGEGRYIAIRHFNCTDMFYIDVDDIQLSNGAKGNRAGIENYIVYRSTEANGTYTQVGVVPAVAGQTYYEYIDTPATAGTYYYQVRADYGDCESEPAISGENPAVNYVTVMTTGMDENNDNVALYPNPTKGNVTIEANGMSRITVVSILGQVVFDTELNADNYTLNMSQFNSGMYLVRIYTENGVTVKRVTVMQ